MPGKSAIIDALRNGAQSASNNIAEGVSAPVDGVAWAMRQAGIPVEQPMFGSEFMREYGLTAPVEPGVSRAVGETIGLTSPMAFTKEGGKALMKALSRGQQ
jgi:hypothetical protein